jgi:phosphatidylserine/phosphatidylglycerophosphate/cardiolipin synthase-like enzyme
MKTIVKSLFILIFICGGVAVGFLLQRQANERLFGKVGAGQFKIIRSPNDDVVKAMTSLFGVAKKELLVSARVLNSEALANALLAAKNKGVEVKVLLSPDLNPSSSRGAAKFLLAQGIEVRWSLRPLTDQCCIIDRQYVATGSLPWDSRISGVTLSSLAVIEGAAIAGAYTTLFAERWEEGQKQPNSGK